MYVYDCTGPLVYVPLQAYLGDIVGLVPTTVINEYHNKTSPNFLVGGGSCRQFAKNTTSMKCNTVKHNNRRCACISFNCF